MKRAKSIFFTLEDPYVMDALASSKSSNWELVSPLKRFRKSFSLRA